MCVDPETGWTRVYELLCILVYCQLVLLDLFRRCLTRIDHDQ